MRIERGQLNQALADCRTQDRSFVLVADKLRQRMRVRSVSDAIQLIHTGHETAQIDCARWMTVSEWLTRWISCDVGPISRMDDVRSVEKLLEAFVVEAPDDWERPWGHGDAADYPSDQIPARAWLEMIFRQTGREEG